MTNQEKLNEAVQIKNKIMEFLEINAVFNFWILFNQ